jgi:putative DNA primase/helicase
MITSPIGDDPHKQRTPEAGDLPGQSLNELKSDYTESKQDQQGKGKILTQSLYEVMLNSIVPFTTLGKQGVPKRLPIMGDWFNEADYGIIYAQRGVGKTWFSMGMAAAINKGESFGPWQVHDTPGVLYVDGEMPAHSLHKRMEGMGSDDLLLCLNHEVLHHKGEKILNLGVREMQDAVTRACLAKAVKVVFLDNLSSLVMGVAEDKADDWETMLQWFLNLRRHGIAVVLVLHAGRSNQNPRGTSRREDHTSWVIKLDSEDHDAGDEGSGARFVSRFEKNRNSQTEPPAIQWHFRTDEESKVSIKHSACDPLEAVIGWVRNGLTGANQIAETMGISPASVSKIATKAISMGRLKKDKREYALP